MTESDKKITMAARRHEFFVLRRRQSFQLFCDGCAAEVKFVSLDDAVLFSGLAAREIVRLAEAGELHYLESSGGHLFVCQKTVESFSGVPSPKECGDRSHSEQIIQKNTLREKQ